MNYEYQETYTENLISKLKENTYQTRLTSNNWTETETTNVGLGSVDVTELFFHDSLSFVSHSYESHNHP